MNSTAVTSLTQAIFGGTLSNVGLAAAVMKVTLVFHVITHK
jgi:hypothetical protein